MTKLTENKTIKFSKEQINSLKKLDNLGINVSQFIRLAIKEKIRRDYKNIKEEKLKEYCPF